jgi:hypothetical protein
MGRETQAIVSFRGQSAEAKVLLESTELILRGGIKAKLPRASLSDVRAIGDGLRLIADGELLHVVMAEPEAARWAKAILAPPPSLASKLGVGPARPALVAGVVSDATLAEALAGATTTDATAAVALIAIIEDLAGLAVALSKAAETDLPCWCVYLKGKAADPGDAAVRAAFRNAGLIDNKTCAVSARLTATRYVHKH